MLATNSMRRRTERYCFHSGKSRYLNDYYGQHPNLYRHGLSYATFELSSSAVKSVPEVFHPGQRCEAIVKLKNTGNVAGAQVLQLYISAPDSPTERPLKELHGFEKVFLDAREEAEVRILIDQYATSFWDEIESMWKSEAGTYDILIGVSSQEILGRGKLIVPETRFWLGL